MKRLRLIGGSLIALNAAYPCAAWAQDGGAQINADLERQEEEDDESSESEIVVTGTGIRGIAPVGSESIVLDRETLLETGARDATEIIQLLPQASSLGYQEVPPPEGGSPNTGRGSSINLRGLGTNATLVLLNGRRLAGQGTTDQFTDPNQIPFAAIERVEVILDGASAIYGSDAVAGVVNYILRRDYEGLEITGRYRTGIYEGYTGSIFGGTEWGSGSVMGGVSYDYRGGFLNAERDYLRDDLSPLGGDDNRWTGAPSTTTTPGMLGNIVANGNIYAIPDTGGETPTAADVLANVGDPNLVDSAEYTWYQPERRRLTVFGRIRQAIGDIGAIALTSNYSRRKSKQADAGITSIRVRNDSPYFIEGLTPSSSYTVSYNTWLNGYRNYSRNLDESWNSALEFDFNLGSSWDLSGFISYGENKGCGVCTTPLNPYITGSNASATEIVTNTDPLFNPYVTGRQGALDRAYGINRQETSFQLVDALAKVDGPLFSIGGGDVRVAAGAEHARTEMSLTLTTSVQAPENVPVKNRDTSIDREVTSAFVELYVPLIGSANAAPGLQELDLTAAVRYDHYSDFGSTTNPKFGFNFVPFDVLTIRGTWGTSFRAPTLSEINPGVIELAIRLPAQNFAGDPAIPADATGRTWVLNRIGNTAGLKPEEAAVWSLGADFEPINDLRFGVTYYSVDYSNRIQFIDLFGAGALLNAENRALYDRFITPAVQPDICVAGDYSTYAQAYQDVLSSPNLSPPPSTQQDCQLGAIFFGGQQNFGQWNQDGLDISVNYSRDIGPGRITLGANWTEILNLTRQFGEDSPQEDLLDRIGFAVSSRGRANVGFLSGGLNLNLAANYVGSYLNDVPATVDGVLLPVGEVPSWATFDLNVSYRFHEESSLLQGLRVSMNISNLTDKDPPLVLTGDRAFDNANANPFGRMWSFEISKSF